MRMPIKRAAAFLCNMRWAFCRYRLEFKHPFTTAHGSRTGTDAVFVRLEHAGHVGYGEATLPPYLKEKPDDVVATLQQVAGLEADGPDQLLEVLQHRDLIKPGNAGGRAAIHTALIDVIGKIRQLPVHELLGISKLKQGIALVTVGIVSPDMVETRLKELPMSGGLKIKVKDASDAGIIRIIRVLDPRPLLLDANQGLPDVDAALQLIAAAQGGLLGLEQPFETRNEEAQKAIGVQTDVCIYADEAVCDMAQLEVAAEVYNGLNIKLMKCGGLDRAKDLALRAGQLGMKVMLGSMSESSLGCTALGHLAGMAELLDLDGPVLIKNDPFVGAEMKLGQLVMPDAPGIGADLVRELDFRPI